MHLLFLGYFIAVTAAIGEKCQTPSGQNGECVPLAECKSLLWSFANPKEGTVEYLKKFECADDHDNGIFVCCHITTDYLVFEDDEDNWDSNSIHNIKHLTNVQNCGIQQNPYRWNNTYKRFSLDDVRIDYYTGKGNNCQIPYNSYTTNCSSFQTFEVEDLILHPFYDPVTKLNDLAVLRLNRMVDIPGFIRPICLPLMLETFNNNVMYILSWNETRLLTDVSVKTTKTSTSIPNYVCQRLNNGAEVVTTFDICTVNHTGADNFIGYPVTTFYENQWYIIGFTSRGKTPRVHTRVQNYLQWIKGALGRERCLTPSNEAGLCILLSDCPRLMEAFANAGPKDEEYLKKFVCKSPADVIEGQIESQTITVCCGNTPNFNISITSTNTDMYKLSNSGYCGLQHRDDYLSFDETLSVDEFPWLVAVINGTVPSEHVAVCAGSLITDRYVLTSADCGSFEDDDIMLVRLGDYNLKTDVDCLKVPGFSDFDCNAIQEYEVEERKIHPFYSEVQKINDISLLRLKELVEFTDYVRPICLPTTEDDVTHLGEIYYMTGYGGNGSEIEGPRIKKKIFTSLISRDICNEYWKVYNYATPSTEYEICTGLFKNSTDAACVGDEGGPVMLSKRFQWYIVGIASTFGCRSGEPISHLKVFKYLKWIKSNLKH
ncbi:hypothetical protein FQR65_LT10131 [Abscondita terminalis]|nr:hypothetical protein FQR65_LT10131 [Abscondita terminalis]